MKQPDGVRFVIDVLETDLDLLTRRGRQILANVISPDRQFAMAAVDQGGELNPSRPAKGTDRVHRGTGGSTGKENVIDNDDGAILERQRQFRRVHHRQLRARADIVTMHRHVDGPGCDIDLRNFANESGESASNLNSAQWNSCEHDRSQIGVLLDNFVRYPPQCALDRCRVLELGCGLGTNLIAIAQSLPGSRCLGIDLSPRQIAAGQAMIQTLGLSNIELQCLDVQRRQFA